MLDLSNVDTQRVLLIAVQSIFILGFVIEMYRSAYAVDDVALTRIFWKAAVYAAAFFVGRIVGAYVDIYFGFKTAWGSNLAMIVAFGFVYLRARFLRLVLSSPKNDELRIEIRNDLREITNRLRTAKQNLQSF
jgi:hypothetical protein